MVFMYRKYKYDSNELLSKFLNETVNELLLKRKKLVNKYKLKHLK